MLEKSRTKEMGGRRLKHGATGAETEKRDSLKNFSVMLNLFQHPRIKYAVFKGLRIKPAMTFILFLASISVSAQDTITLRNGNEIKAKVTEISTKEIKYKRFENLEGQTVTIPIAEVFFINYENGVREVFNSQNTEQTTTKNSLENTRQEPIVKEKAEKEKPQPAKEFISNENDKGGKQEAIEVTKKHLPDDLLRWVKLRYPKYAYTEVLYLEELDFKEEGKVFRIKLKRVDKFAYATVWFKSNGSFLKVEDNFRTEEELEKTAQEAMKFTKLYLGVVVPTFPIYMGLNFAYFPKYHSGFGLAFHTITNNYSSFNPFLCPAYYGFFGRPNGKWFFTTSIGIGWINYGYGYYYDRPYYDYWGNLYYEQDYDYVRVNSFGFLVSVGLTYRPVKVFSIGLNCEYGSDFLFRSSSVPGATLNLNFHFLKNKK